MSLAGCKLNVLFYFPGMLFNNYALSSIIVYLPAKNEGKIVQKR